MRAPAATSLAWRGMRGTGVGRTLRRAGIGSPWRAAYVRGSDLEGGGAEGVAVRQLEPQSVEAGGHVGELEPSVHVGRAVVGALLALDLAYLHGATQRRYEPAVQPGAPFVVGRRDPDQQLDVLRAEAERVGLGTAAGAHQLAEALDDQH